MIHITHSAQKYLIKLLTKQKKNTQIRIFVKNPGTPYAKCGICYDSTEAQISHDIIVKFNSFSIYIEKSIYPFIKNTHISIISNELGTQLALKSPNLYKKNNSISDINKDIKDIPLLEDKIKYILQHQINPQLSLHGGGVSLVNITTDFFAVLQFYGGCNGCSMSYYTIKSGIENILKKFLPELKGVIDITHHQRGDHSYY